MFYFILYSHWHSQTDMQYVCKVQHSLFFIKPFSEVTGGTPVFVKSFMMDVVLSGCRVTVLWIRGSTFGRTRCALAHGLKRLIVGNQIATGRVVTRTLVGSWNWSSESCATVHLNQSGSQVKSSSVQLKQESQMMSIGQSMIHSWVPIDGARQCLIWTKKSEAKIQVVTSIITPGLELTSFLFFLSLSQQY